MAKGVGIGILAAIGLSLLLTALVTTMVVRETVTENNIKFYSWGIQYASALLGAIVAYGIVRSKCALMTGITSLAYLFILGTLAVVLYEGITGGIWTSVLAVGLSFLSACTVCISKHGSKRKRKWAPR